MWLLHQAESHVRLKSSIPTACTALVVQRAASYDARVLVCCGQRKAAATSILELLMLVVQQGEELILKAEGPEADKLLDALVELF
ncbi:MAG: HPr family phosphocarrier protein [Planctomycetes bacterium]|nr:HPr family phosphocarrier protein [Planctomycetota bacterium]